MKKGLLVHLNLLAQVPEAARCLEKYREELFFMISLLTIVYELGLSAEKGWRILRVFMRLADVIRGIKLIE